jgi:hypothetical protein
MNAGNFEVIDLMAISVMKPAADFSSIFQQNHHQ